MRKILISLHHEMIMIKISELGSTANHVMKLFEMKIKLRNANVKIVSFINAYQI